MPRGIPFQEYFRETKRRAQELQPGMGQVTYLSEKDRPADTLRWGDWPLSAEAVRWDFASKTPVKVTSRDVENNPPASTILLQPQVCTESFTEIHFPPCKAKDFKAILLVDKGMFALLIKSTRHFTKQTALKVGARSKRQSGIYRKTILQ